MDNHTVARIAYQEFVRLMGYRDASGKPYPPFDDLPKKEKENWQTHVANVRAKLPSSQLVVR